MTNPTNVALIYGSVRPGRLCDTVAGWAAEQIATDPRFMLDVIDPGAEWPHIDELTLRQRIGAADAFVIVTPEYNHSYPGPLKIVIDAVRSEWQAKPVGFVSYGGASGGLRAVEHLRHVFIELSAVPIRASVSFVQAWDVFSDQALTEASRHGRAMRDMLTSLSWWARALASARAGEGNEVAASAVHRIPWSRRFSSSAITAT